MNYLFILIGILFMIYVVDLVRKKTFSAVESFFWVCASIITLIFAIFPEILDWIATKMKITYPPSLLFIMCIMFLLFMNFRFSRKISQVNEKIIYLAQNFAILKNKMESNNEK